jgi:signal transduction histidine kinase
VLDESSREVVEMMDAAAGFMSNTLNDVLSMSKIEDGAITLVVKAFTLISLLETAMRAVKSLASNKAVRIVVKGLSRRDEARSLTVLGDEVRTLQY